MLIDLVKAFERIPHHVLLRFVRRFGYYLKTLLKSIAACVLQRCIGIDGGHSRLVVSVRSITAGPRTATTELKIVKQLDLVLIRREMFAAASPEPMLRLYIDDDLTIRSSVGRTAAVRANAQATDFAVE